VQSIVYMGKARATGEEFLSPKSLLGTAPYVKDVEDVGTRRYQNSEGIPVTDVGWTG